MRYRLHGVSIAHGERGGRTGMQGFPASFAYLHARQPVLDRDRMTLCEDGAWLSDGPVGALGGTNGLCLQSVSDGWLFWWDLRGGGDLVDAGNCAMFCSLYTWYV